MTDEERFFAWLDGELSPDEAAEMERRVAAEPELARLAEQHRAMQSKLRSAFDPVATDAVPERLFGAIDGRQAQVVDFSAERERRDGKHRRGALPQWAAMAATLVAGILIGALSMNGSSGPVETEGGKMFAAASLDRALDVQLASAAAGAGHVRIGLTFRDQSGAVCRSFTGVEASGLACRDGDRWHVRGLVAAPEGQSGAYRMAAGSDPTLAALIDATMAGEPFDAVAEKESKARGWR